MILEALLYVRHRGGLSLLYVPVSHFLIYIYIYMELPHTGQLAIESNPLALQRTCLTATNMKRTMNMSGLIQATKHGTNQERLFM